MNRFYCLLLALSAGLVSCSDATKSGTSSSDGSLSLTIFAAASLRDVLQELCRDFSQDHGLHFVCNFGSSGDLSRQILAARRADVFFSADSREMDRVADAGLLAEETRRELLVNQLVVVEPLESEPRHQSLPDGEFKPELLKSDRWPKVSLAHVEMVPAGRYAKLWLESRGLWDSVAPRVIPAIDVRAALGAVESGVVDLGIVYATDAAQSKRVRVVYVVPVDEGPKITFPVAVLKGTPRADEALKFTEYLRSERAIRIFRRFGFEMANP